MDKLEELKAKAREFLQMAGCYVGDNIVIGEGDIDDLINMTHQATIEECVRIAEGMKYREETISGEFVEMECEINRTIDDLITTITRNSK